MTVEVKVDEITEAVYESNRKWVSVEAELDYALNPVTLFQLTESDFNDRFYFRKNDDSMSFFGYKALKKYKNDVEKKQSIFHEWEKDRKDISFIHPCSEQHHLKLCGGFQFSAHKSDDEWRQFGINHFILPEVLVTIKGDHSYITYTTERETFDIDDFQAIISHLTSTVETTPEDMGAIKKQDDIYKDEWRDLVQQTIEQLDESKKIVLARRRLYLFEKPIYIPIILQRALQNEFNSYIFILESGDSIFFSQTPEQLMEVNDNVLSTKAVAGTIKRTHDEAKDQANVNAFLEDEKNLNEHRFVVKSILNDIEDYVEDVDYNDSPDILKNDSMYHLYTEIKALLKDGSYIGLLDHLHPTPALGGYPKDEAVDYIEQNEFGTRGLYGSPAGFIDIYNNCEFIVAIRSMLIKGNQATLFAGCGIVSDSVADSEVAETAVKFTPMMRALGVEDHDNN